MFGLTSESGKRISDVAQFAIDYTFYMNVGFALVAGGLVWLNRRHSRDTSGGHDHGGAALPPKCVAAFVAVAVIIGGLIARVATS